VKIKLPLSAQLRAKNLKSFDKKTFMERFLERIKGRRKDSCE